MTAASRTLTERLDDLQESLPAVPSKVVDISRSTARRVNSAVATVARDLTGRTRTVVDATSTSAKTTAGQARSAVERTTRTARSGVAETTGQARAQAKAAGRTITNEVDGALDDAKLAVDPNELTSLTKSELYDRAQDLDIDGRSAMSKAELVSAIERA